MRSGRKKVQLIEHRKCLTNVGQLKNIMPILILLTILFSCDDHANFMTRIAPIDIYESTIPTSGTVNQDIQILLKAQATNGCYSDLEISLIEIDSRHFLIKATGLFKTNGICPNVMVYKDTVINFKPTSTGDYFFQINEDPFEIKNEKVEIN
jgi:hypothetical protein